MIGTEEAPRTRADQVGEVPPLGQHRRGSVRTIVAFLAGVVLVISGVGAWGVARQIAEVPVPGAGPGGQPLPDLPVSFVENRGQTDPEVRFSAQGPDHAFFFTRDRLVMSFDEGTGERLVLALRFVGADPGVEPQGQAPTGGRVNYVRGDDPAGWQTGLPTFGTLVYPELWPGVDMVFRGDDGQLKYEFRVRPGADPRQIRLGYTGADGLAVDPAGELLIATPLGELRDSAPVSYQEIDGVRRHVESRYELGPGTEYGFAVGDHRPDRELVIDPALQYSTFLGGASMDRAEDMVVDSSGNATVVGVTQSTDFPVTVGGAFNGGIMDAFVARLTPDGTGLVYATYLGGTPTPTRRGNTDDVEIARSVAVDGDGNAYVTGQTDSGDFPTTPGAFQTALKVGEQQATDAFVTKLGPSGTLAYSTFLGGELGKDDGRVISVDGSGNAYVAGSTFAGDFPTTSGAFDTTQAGGEDVFVAKLDATGSALAYSTLLGGTDNELSHGLAVDASGNAYVSGSTRSADFPSTAGAFQPSHSGGEFAELFEAFVTKVGATGTSLVWSTFLGGTEIDHGGELAVDPGGSAHVLVATQSPTFPTTAGAYDSAFTGTSETAVVKLDATGSALQYSTFLNGGGAASITLDGGGNAWLAGTAGAGAPVTADGQPNCGGNDAWISRLDATGSALGFATFLGGTANDNGSAIDLGPAGDVHVAGTTMSADFPTTAGAFDREWAGDASIFWGDAFAAKLTTGAGTVSTGCGATGPVLSSVSLSPTSVEGGGTSTGTVTLDSAAPDGGVSVSLASSDPAVATVPAGVTVPAGGTSATFDVSTAAVGADTSVTISATAGDVARTATLSVTAAAATETTTFSGRVDRNRTVTHTVAMGAGTVEVRLDWNDARADLDLRVLDPAGTVVFTNTGSSRPKTGTFSATAAGDHRVEVINSSRRNADYTLTVTHPVVSSSPPADTTAPTVSLSSPEAGSTVSGTVPVQAAATDDVGVSEVRFLVDGAQIGVDTTAPYSVSWDTTTAADGERSLTATAVDAAGNSATSAAVAVTVSNTAAAPEPVVSLSAVAVDPSTVTGGNGSTGTVTLSSAAPAGGSTVALASSDTAATVPGSVTVAEGATSATFPVTTGSVSADTTVTISATLDGTTRTATLTVTAPASTTDTVTITRAEYDPDDDQLEVRASSSDASATLTVHVTATGELIGTLSSGRGTFDWPTNPENITVRSSLGGSATSPVTAG